MDTTPKSKEVVSKDDVSLLVDLIQCNPVLTSKETNATTNKCKEDAWTDLVSTFNARSGSIPKSKEQLKLKWDNFKKAARKRAQVIRINNLKTGGGKPDPIPVDEILDKVSSLLGSTCSGFMVPFGGDGVARPNVEVLNKTSNRGIQERKRKVIGVHEMNSSVGGSSNNFFGMPMSDRLKTKRGYKRKENDGRLARNLAIASYYNKKSEKLALEIKKLRLELEHKENINVNNVSLD